MNKVTLQNSKKFIHPFLIYVIKYYPPRYTQPIPLKMPIVTKLESSYVGKCLIKIPDPDFELYKWDLDLSPKSKLIANLARVKQTSYDFNELKFRSGMLSGVDHSWSISIKPDCNYITTTLELPDDKDTCMSILDSSTLELWHEKDGKPEVLMVLSIQFSKTTNTKKNSWTNQARLLDTSWTDKVVMIRFTFTLRIQTVVRASYTEMEPLLLSPTAIQPLNDDNTKDNQDNSTISIGMPLLNSGQLSDVILVCEGTEVPAHRLILASKSSVFCTMFERKEMREAQEGRVNLEEIDLPTLALMLEFVYSGKLEKLRLTEKNAMELYRIADRFGILDLKSICAQRLLSELKPDNAVEIYALANTHNDQFMMNAAVQILKYNRKEAFKYAGTLKEFCNAFPETMFKIFNSW